MFLFVIPYLLVILANYLIRKDENLVIPADIDYSKLSGLSNEVKSKFKLIRPKTLGQALRIDGITPAAAYILLSHVKKRPRKTKIA